MYFVALDGVSRYALSGAVKSIIRGSLGHTFFPSPVEIKRECDRVMEWHYRQERQTAIQEKNERENAAYRERMAQRTPEALARVRSIYERFCADYESSAAKQEPILDPELIAKVPDAKDYFKKAKVA